MEQQTRLRLGSFIVTEKSFYRRAFLLILPIVLQSIINQGVNMMDTVMVGKLGESAISASSLANQFYNIFTFLCMGVSAAGLVLSSQYYGAKDLKTVRNVFDFVLQLILAGGTVFALVTALLPEQIMRIFTKDEEVIALGAQYLRVAAFIYLPHGLSLVVANVMRSIGNARLGLYVSIVSFVVNIGANYLFIFGKLGAPALGVMGAAVGTLIARLTEFVFCMTYLLRIEKVLKYRPQGLLKLPGKKLFGEFRRLGMPAIISDSLLALAASMISIILGHMGKEVVSAYAIVSVMDRLATVAIQGATSAAGVIIGQSVGEGKFKRAQKEGWTFLMLAAIIGVVGGILVYVLGEWSIGLYEIAPSTVEITTRMMEASAVIVFFQAVQSSLSKGILRGGGDTRFLMVADIIFQWVASIPLGALTGIVLKLPPEWALIALRIDFIIKSVWLVFRLKSGKWIHKAKKV